MPLFLRDFELKKNLYDNLFQKIMSMAISTDHTFKVRKNIGFARKVAGKFTKQFSNCFIVLSDSGEVKTWRLTRSTAFVETEAKIETGKCSTEAAYVDDCCHVHDKYKSVFGNVEVLLDLFHAWRHISSTTDKCSVLSLQFSKEFGLIFRQDEDQDNIRLKHTPDRVKIEEKLNVLINRWAYVKDGPMTQETFHAMENLRVHIRKGCLSDIPPGCGTEQNEYIHWIVGSTSISVELAITILTIISFHMNTKKRYKDVYGDAHLQGGVPVEWVAAREKLGTHCEESIEPIKRVQDRSECQSSTS